MEQTYAGLTFLLKSITSAPTTGADTRIAARDVKTYEATIDGTGAVTATVIIEGKNTGNTWTTIGTLTLSGTTTTSDAFTSTDRFKLHRARLTAISGTGATVSATVGS